jgi:SEL1 protein
MLALMYATGIGVARNYPKSLIYSSFATIEGDIQASHMLGYWHFAGIGVQKNCEKSLWYYERVADKVIEKFKTGPRGGLYSPRYKVYLHGKNGGIFGKMASGTGDPSSKGSNAGLRESDIVMLYRLQAESGDAVSQLMIGQYYYLGSQHEDRDFKKAMYYFTNAAKQYPEQTALDKGDSKVKQVAVAASQSAGFIGEMYLFLT